MRKFQVCRESHHDKVGGIRPGVNGLRVIEPKKRQTRQGMTQTINKSVTQKLRLNLYVFVIVKGFMKFCSGPTLPEVKRRGRP